ncbi:MAG: AAA family ATPase [Gammaproteobacteria bacterium]|nr:AAA family ATPase [Gammaproteobacteria bacterium]MCY4219783.1 AAA family ATPase [Gammaproteobacteria bacterium]MCY4275787.1 AAA family ATPase [Gammaproteobacteria bacterium]
MTDIRAELKDLFRPGTGAEPPYLAGRLEEQAFFNDRTEKLVQGQEIISDMIIYGPRGNGKTAMLRYLQRKTDERLETLWVTPSEFEDTSQLIDLIDDNDPRFLKKFQNLFKPLFDNLSASANIGLAQAQTSLSRPKETLALKDVLRKKCKQKPFLMIIDEAHTLSSDIGRVLLNVSQDIRGEGCPFFLVLAGTPNLETELRKVNATFWSRSAIFPLGRLSSEEAQEALTLPLKQHRVFFDQEVAAEVSSRALCYPYFIQVWGDCIAKRLHETGADEVTLDTIREVEEQAMAKCNSMYKDRYAELREMNLRFLATRIGEALDEADKQFIPEKEFEELVGKILQEQGTFPTIELILDTIRKLFHIGYIWEISVPSEVEGEDPLLCYEPGIPSLMKYVRKQTKGEAGK